jgi:hypothetical protein
MYVTTVPNRGSRPTVLVRETYREDGKVKNRTLANLTHLPAGAVEAVQRVLRGESGATIDLASAFDIVESRPHGHVAAVLGTMRKLGLSKLLGRPCRERELCLALIAARVVDPRSKLATAQGLDAETCTTTLGQELGVVGATADELYAAMDWLLARQETIESALAKRHLSQGGSVLYDLTSTYMEGSKCPLAVHGYSRDKRSDRPQVNFGLMTDDAGRPISVSVFAGNTADAATIPEQLSKLRERFLLDSMILIGDRGMITEARIANDLRPAGFDWITALRAPAIQELRARNAIQLGLFDDRDLAEIHDPAFPDERLVVCRNADLAAERARNRATLIAKTEAALDKVVRAVSRKKAPLRGAAAIGLRVGKVIEKWKMQKHFVLEIGNTSFSYRRDQENIAREAATDGIYVLRTSVKPDRLSAPDVVRSYKGLSRAERAFRSMKTIDLHVRPVFHRLEGRVRSHIFLCMLAYYVEWHMREALAPILYDDHEKSTATPSSPVAPATVSQAARRKRACRKTDDGLPILGFRALLANLATVVRDTCQTGERHGGATFTKVTVPSPLQERAFALLGFPLGP